MDIRQWAKSGLSSQLHIWKTDWCRKGGPALKIHPDPTYMNYFNCNLKFKLSRAIFTLYVFIPFSSGVP